MIASLRNTHYLGNAFLMLPLLLNLGVCWATGPVPYPDSISVVLRPADPAQIERLANQGFDIAGVDLEDGSFTVLTDTQGLQQLTTGRGIRQVSARFDIPVLDSGYRRLGDVTRILEQTQRDFPRLAFVTEIGRSHDNRPIPAIRLTDSFFVPAGGKTVVLFDALHHAREVMTTEVALDIVETLTAGYATDARVRTWMRRHEIWVVPMVNPDGSHRVWSNQTQWRKNSFGGYGVDNNRNYPWDWGSCNGSSSNRFNETYRGPSAGSEPETQALMALARQIQPLINVSYHSFSELVLYPFGCRNRSIPPSERSTLETVGRELAAKHRRDSGNGTYLAGRTFDYLYPTDGGSIDWMFGELRTLAYVVELNSQSQGFQPSHSRWRDQTVRNAREGWKYVLDRLTGPSIHVAAPPGRLVSIHTAMGQPVSQKPANRGGWAHFIVPQGRYNVTLPETRSALVTVDVAGKPSQVSFASE